MKINWFSPVPPARTAIANVTERVVPSLAKRMEVTVWTDTDDFDPSCFPGIDVRSCCDVDRFWPIINFADFSIYHIGNDARFHGRYASMLERHPGIVVLHDFNLHELHRERLIHTKDGQKAFNQFVLRNAGTAALKTVLQFQQGKLSFEETVNRVPLIQSVTRHATGIISFNEAMKEALRAETPAPLLLCPLPLGEKDTLPPETVHHLKEGGPVEVVMFGYLNSPNRRLHDVLEALSAFSPGQVRLTLFGHIMDQAGLEDRIRNLKIAGMVRYLGFLSDQEMEQVLKASHLAINLRNPSRGESSDALLKAWKYALPVLVTRTGYYATLPEAIVCHVSPGEETRGIRGHLQAFLKSPETYFKTGSNAYHHLLTNHTAESFSESLEEFLLLAEPFRKKSFVFNFARQLGSLLEENLPPAPAKLLHERMAVELADWIKNPSWRRG